MTREEKQLLLKDLCARLPYGVIMGNKTLLNTHYMLRGADIDEAEFDDEFDDIPYLRPMSSMTEEEFRDYNTFPFDTDRLDSPHYLVSTYSILDWLLEHHIDYRGLIEKGLALEAPKNMYKEE